MRQTRSWRSAYCAVLWCGRHGLGTMELCDLPHDCLINFDAPGYNTCLDLVMHRSALNERRSCKQPI